VRNNRPTGMVLIW